MAEKWITAGVTVALAIIGVAVLAVLVSKQSQTGSVIGSGAGGIKDMLCAALSPIGVNCGSRSLIPDVNSRVIF